MQRFLAKQWLVLAWVLVVGVARSSHAAPIEIGTGGSNPFLVDPLYFIAPSPGNETPIGLEGPGDGVVIPVSPNAFSISACGTGGGCDLSIAPNLILPVFQNPQNPAASSNPQTTPGTPTKSVPFVADSTWTVQNTSGVAITDAWLLFTSVAFTSLPVVDVALDQFVYSILAIPDGATTGYYGGRLLGDLAAGESKALTVRYIVAGDLPESGGSLLLQPFGVSGLLVPEPASAALVSFGFAVLGFVTRRRCA